ncbi:PstS family phosphate ABC transporter substrate-binding protein [Halanaerobiaceae bacterium Z-7014]|uniref:Phosphate-binding protein n=1 Tax=Halonatronomonas betaini TaxID=2778430 RepID=A0A931AW61_9FIRM|nr:PstS family phosphate ABC transporter substrate-binding protein [Halonatronomonas betaini]MBF8437206.1 PstS family phosphate ABC transporter substrate-binding protein [Halonatronomonas betaini]
MKKVLLVAFLMVFTLMAGMGQVEANDGFFEIRGSDTQVNLTGNLAEAFMDLNPETVISVTGGGSGTGIAGIINNQFALANSSREISEAEMEQARERGVEPVRIVIALDALSVVVHEDNPVSELTVDQIGAIFRGEITNWSEVGGEDKEISMYGRQSNSGTYVFFREYVVKGDYSDDKMRMNGNAQIVEGVLSDDSGIGYVGVGYTVDEGEVIDGLKMVNVAIDENSPYVSPMDPANVADGSYPVARPLHHYSNGQPEGMVREYIEFVLSDEGQQVAVDSGFYPITDEYREINRENLGW